jgi:hypothetical protein
MKGFKAKTDKTKTELAKDRQTVLNFVVNTKVNLPREKRSAIRKEVITANNSGQPRLLPEGCSGFAR